MRMMKRIRGLWTLGVAALGVLTVYSTAHAQESRNVSTEVSGSVVIFPKVIWDCTRDTIIQIANTGNTLVFAHCFYIDGAPRNPALPPSSSNPAQCNETDFTLVLTRQQPTMWVASAGRRTDNSDGFGVYGSGYDPGLIPPVPQGFQGELKCIQVDESLHPITGNRLKGEATLRDVNGDVSTYNAIALPANSGVVPGPGLELTLTPANDGGDYAACPDTLILNHYSEGANDPALNSNTSLGGVGACTPGGCSVGTTLTLVPCSEDLENQIPSRVTLGILTYDEFESRLSTSFTVDCWYNRRLNFSPFTLGSMGGSTTRHTRIRPIAGAGGVIGVAEATHSIGNGNTTVAAYNLQTQGNRFDRATQGDNDTPVAGVTDRILIPVE